MRQGEVAGLQEETTPPLRVEVIVPDWATYLVVALLSAIVVLLVVVVVLVVGMRRL
jgi:hypothetical protein